MNVYGKIDEKQEESHYQDWSAPEKREGVPIPFFSIMLMVQAGPGTDATIQALLPHLDKIDT